MRSAVLLGKVGRETRPGSILEALSGVNAETPVSCLRQRNEDAKSPENPIDGFQPHPTQHT